MKVQGNTLLVDQVEPEDSGAVTLLSDGDLNDHKLKNVAGIHDDTTATTLLDFSNGDIKTNARLDVSAAPFPKITAGSDELLRSSDDTYDNLSLWRFKSALKVRNQSTDTDLMKWNENGPVESLVTLNVGGGYSGGGISIDGNNGWISSNAGITVEGGGSNGTGVVNFTNTRIYENANGEVVVEDSAGTTSVIS